MSKLISDFFCVATSGATIDSREIQPEWLTGSAKAYNADFYAARIWFEHIRYFGAMGDVFAVKAEKGDDGLIRLYNRIIPSAQLVSMKKNGQALYSSIEVAPVLKATGKPYQVGLAVTDSPASFGTDRLEFSKALEADSIFSAAMEIEGLEFNKERSFFDMAKAWALGDDKAQLLADGSTETLSTPETPPAEPAIIKLSAPDINQTPPKQDIDMNKEDLTALFKEVLEEKLAAQKQAFSEQLTEAVKPLIQKIDAQAVELTELKGKQDEVIVLATPPVGSNPNENHHAGGDPEIKKFDC